MRRHRKSRRILWQLQVLRSVGAVGTSGRSCQPRLEALEDRQLPATFLVTTTADSGPSSLRQAILDSNTSPGSDTIAFQIGKGGAQRIAPLSALPVLTDPVVIDGSTQPGYTGSPIIELHGGQAGAAHGLWITAGNSRVRGLVINAYDYGIRLEGIGGNLIAGNFIGTDVTGAVERDELLIDVVGVDVFVQDPFVQSTMTGHSGLASRR